MKIGIRTPSIKRFIKARTTGRVKRSIKRTVNPLYGKKGMGYIKDPERAIKNKIYHKTTIDSRKLLNTKPHNVTTTYQPKPKSAGKGILIAMFLGIFGGYRFYKNQIGLGFLYLFTGGLCGIGWLYDIMSAFIDYSDELEKQSQE